MDEVPVESPLKESNDNLRAIHPVLPWQYSEIEDEWGEIVGHAANPDCPCAEGNENCLRKHGKRIVKLAGETMMMDTDPERRKLLAYWQDSARDLVKRSEMMVWSLGAKLPIDVDWARVQKKAAELILRKNAQLSLIDRMKVHYAERKVERAINEVARDTQKDINLRLAKTEYLPKSKGDTTMAISGESMKNRAVGQVLGRFTRLMAHTQTIKNFEAIVKARTDAKAKDPSITVPSKIEDLGLMDNYDTLATLVGGVAAFGLYGMQDKDGLRAHPSIVEVSVEAGLNLASQSVDYLYNAIPPLETAASGDTFKVRSIDIEYARSAARMQGGSPGGASRKSANVEQFV